MPARRAWVAARSRASSTTRSCCDLRNERTRDRRPGCSEGAPATHRARRSRHDELLLLDHAGDWFVRKDDPALTAKRVLKRVDMTSPFARSRSSSRALLLRGHAGSSCSFAVRPLLHGRSAISRATTARSRPIDPDRTRRISASYPMAKRPDAAASTGASYGDASNRSTPSRERHRCQALEAFDAELKLGLVTFALRRCRLGRTRCASFDGGARELCRPTR